MADRLGSHFLIFSLKLSIETEFLISNRIICHTFEAKHLIEFSPYWLVQALFSYSLFIEFEICYLTLNWKDFA